MTQKLNGPVFDQMHKGRSGLRLGDQRSGLSWMRRA